MQLIDQAVLDRKSGEAEGSAVSLNPKPILAVQTDSQPEGSGVAGTEVLILPDLC
jgi:hypothetical protein